MAHQGFVHATVGRVVHGLLVDGPEALDVVGHVDDGKAQHRRRRSPALDATLLFVMVGAFQVAEQYLEEELQRGWRSGYRRWPG